MNDTNRKLDQVIQKIHALEFTHDEIKRDAVIHRREISNEKREFQESAEGLEQRIEISFTDVYLIK